MRRKVVQLSFSFFHFDFMSSPPTTLDTRPYNTRTAGSASSSDFLLLTTDQSPLLAPSTTSNSIPLPPPRFRPVLQAAAVLDLLFVLGYGTMVPLKTLPLSAIGINSLRSLVVLSAVSSVRVRENAPVLLGQLIVSVRFNSPCLCSETQDRFSSSPLSLSLLDRTLCVIRSRLSSSSTVSTS